MKLLLRFLLVTAGAFLLAAGIRTFVHTAGLLPGGFTGIALLLQEVFSRFLGLRVPFSAFYWGLNIVPAAVCFRYVGRRFTLLSIWAIVASGLFTEILPGFGFTRDAILCSVFGGIVNGAAVSLCLLAGATSGGTDFISIYVSEKTGRSVWNHIFVGNVAVLLVFALLFGWTRALYSIVFQFASTQILNALYRRCQKSTLLIVTDSPAEVVRTIRETTGHDATLFRGEGCYTGAERNMLYAVVSGDEEERLVRQVKKIDPGAFVNILQTKMLKGNFIMKKQD